MTRAARDPVAVFAQALRRAADGHEAGARLRSVEGTSRPLDLRRYVGPVTAADRTVLDRCAGPTLDVGCGPGRFTAALATRGLPALGADICPEAVRQCRARGGAALLRDVHATLPREGAWAHVLLTDGNIGIGADPGRLLRRAAALLHPHGELVCETAEPDVPLSAGRYRLELDGLASDWFGWAHVGVTALARLALDCGLRLSRAWSASAERAVPEEAGRWFAAFCPA